MSRLLHRPMFRRGGSTGEGITSGLRRGYGDGNSVPGMGKPQYYPPRKEFKTQSTGRPRGSSGADFWLNLGTNILAQPGGRPILQTLGTAAKEPLSQFQKTRASQEARDYQRRMYDEKFAFEKEKFGEEKKQFGMALEQDWRIAEMEAQGEKQFMAEQIDAYWDPLIAAETDAKEIKRLENEKAAEKYRIIVRGFDVSDQYKILSNAQAMELSADRAENEIRNTKNKKTGLIWAESDAGYDEFYQSLVNKYMRLATKFLEDEKEEAELDAAGGRVGRAFGGGMAEDVNVMTRTPGGISDINVSETMRRDPGETNEINISYEQLRDRLPAEISNEIVLLLSQSYEAFADFAELQTQADVNEFNTKYNVQLFLPQQSGV